MKKNSNFLIVISSILLVFIFSISVINSNNATETSASSISEKRIGWGIKRSNNNEQPDLGSINKKIIDTYEGIAMGNKDSKYVYLTFDNGYEAGYTPKILAVLKENQVPATFFITAHYLNTASDLVKQMIDEGHTIGNHTVNHKSMPDLILSNFITVEYGDLDFDIKNYVKASDSYEGDLTSSVTISGLDIYKLGDQTVTIFVSDSSGNVRSVSKVITVVDTTAPVLELSKYNDTIYLGEETPDLRGYIKRCDDNTSEINMSDVEIDATSFLMEYGSYTITYKVHDKANNYCIRKLNLSVSYKEAPVIECKDLEFEQNETINLKDYIKVSDLYDESMSSNYKLYDSALDTKTPGKYEIFVEATNMAGHSTIAKFYVTVKAKNSDTKNTFYDIYEYIYENKLVIILAIIVISGVIVGLLIKKANKKI